MCRGAQDINGVLSLHLSNIIKDYRENSEKEKAVNSWGDKRETEEKAILLQFTFINDKLFDLGALYNAFYKFWVDIREQIRQKCWNNGQFGFWKHKGQMLDIKAIKRAKKKTW